MIIGIDSKKNNSLLYHYYGGEKLNKICNQKNILSLCNNYGSIVYIPITNKINGIIRKDFMKDYEIILKG